jgi:hypothetical protein
MYERGGMASGVLDSFSAGCFLTFPFDDIIRRQLGTYMESGMVGLGACIVSGNKQFFFL